MDDDVELELGEVVGQLGKQLRDALGPLLEIEASGAWLVKCNFTFGRLAFDVAHTHTHTQFIDARVAEPKGQLSLLCSHC